MAPQTNTPQNAEKPRKRRRLTLWAAGIVGVIALMVCVWNWDWFVPLVNRQASAALHRPVSIEHLHFRPGLTTTVSVDGLRIAQPEAFKDRQNLFASAKKATVSFDLWRYVTGKGLAFPLIALDTPKGDIVQRANGQTNYDFSDPKKPEVQKKPSPNKDDKGEAEQTRLPEIGELKIKHGDIQVTLAKLATDVQVNLETTPATAQHDESIIIDLKGRYAKAPIKGHIVAGALLKLANGSKPYPIDAQLENGPTKIALKGTVDDPLNFKGTNLKLHLTGPDMAKLYEIIDIPIPHTPPYDVSGRLEYTKEFIRFSHFAGKMGTSDIGGIISVKPQTKPMTVDAQLQSRNVDIKDLGGFIGADPGSQNDRGKKSSNGRVFPSTPINVPKLKAVNAHLLYRGRHIENPNLPLDDIAADINIQDGAIAIHKLDFAVGSGRLGVSGTLKPSGHDNFRTRLKVDVAHLSVKRLMSATHLFDGKGTLSGNMTLSSVGNSVATLLANGNGGITLVIGNGGDISALLPDLLGLKLGSALLSSVGVPKRTELKCFVADLPLRNGILKTNSFLLLTDDTRTLGEGTVNLKHEKLDYHVTTRATRFNILSFPGQINIGGTLASPSILPGAEIVGRAAATAGLAVAFPPAALLATIQFGVDEKNACRQALARAAENPASGVPARPEKDTGSSSGKNAHTKIHSATTPSINPAHIRAVWQKRLAEQAKKAH